MKTYSSSDLRLLKETCPKALDFYENHVPRDNTIFEVGVSAHAVIESSGKGQDVAPYEKTLTKLCSEPRVFRGNKLPPVHIESAITGRDLARGFLEQNGLPLGASYEIELGMDAAGYACDIPDARFIARIDMLHYEEIETQSGLEYPSIVTTDWKTDWQSTANALDTLQLKGHSVLAHADQSVVNPPQAITRRIGNLQTQNIYHDTIVLDEDGEAKLNKWSEDILLACDIADNTRRAIPGIGCMKCPYFNSCKDAQDLYKIDALDGPDLSQRYFVAKAQSDLFQAMLKEMTAERSIDIATGYLGYKRVLEKTGSDRTSELITQAVCGESMELPQTAVTVLLDMLSLGSGNINAFAKKWFKSDSYDAKKEFLDLAIGYKGAKRWGPWEDE